MGVCLQARPEDISLRRQRLKLVDPRTLLGGEVGRDVRTARHAVVES